MKYTNLAIIALLILITACSGAPLNQVLDVQDFGTSCDESGHDVVAKPDGAGIMVVGITCGGLHGTNRGGFDAFIRNYNGGVIWGRQFGTPLAEDVKAVAVDSSGGSYVLGTTFGNLGGRLGNRDVYLRKYTPAASLVWTRQFGTTGGDFAWNLVVKGNVIYTLSSESGQDVPLVIRKWDSGGTLLQTIQPTGVNISATRSLAVDSQDRMYVLTKTSTSSREFIKLYIYDSTGTPVASPNVHSSTAFLEPYDLVIDSSNNLYLTFVDSTEGKGAYIRKVTSAGTTIWTRRLEPTSTNSLFPLALTLDSDNNVYVAGEIMTESFQGFTNAGFSDIFALKYSPTGTRRWTFQKGGDSDEIAFGIAVSDAVYVTGSSLSSPNFLGAPSYGGFDAYLMQLNKINGTLIGIDQ